MFKKIASTALNNSDPIVFDMIANELNRQLGHIELIASENFVSAAVLQAQGSILTNKYAEGYPRKRYYGGCQFVDDIEELAIARAKELFGAKYANVQPHSGSQANQAVFFSLLSPGDTILGMGLSHGGHLTHGAAPNISGKWFNAISYGVTEDTCLIDYDQVRSLAKLHKPKLIIVGYSAYSRAIDFSIFRDIADEVGAYLMADIAHIAGIIAAGYHMNPLEYADVVTSTTHKTLRGPRGGLILSNNEEIFKKINSAIFPGIQGGPLMHIIAAKAVAFEEALSDQYRQYIDQVLKNAKVLSARLVENGYNIISGGTDNHMFLVDLSYVESGITGKQAEANLMKCGIVCNKNTIPFEKLSPFITSGIRIGTPACTTIGMVESDMLEIADMIAAILDKGLELDELFVRDMEKKTKAILCKFY